MFESVSQDIIFRADTISLEIADTVCADYGVVPQLKIVAKFHARMGMVCNQLRFAFCQVKPSSLQHEIPSFHAKNDFHYLSVRRDRNSCTLSEICRMGSAKVVKNASQSSLPIINSR